MGVGPEKPVQVATAPGFTVWPGPWVVVSLSYCSVRVSADFGAYFLQQGSSEIGIDVFLLPLVAEHFIESLF